MSDTVRSHPTTIARTQSDSATYVKAKGYHDVTHQADEGFADSSEDKHDTDSNEANKEKEGKPSLRLRFSKSFDQTPPKEKSIRRRMTSMLSHMVGRKGHQGHSQPDTAIPDRDPRCDVSPSSDAMSEPQTTHDRHDSSTQRGRSTTTNSPSLGSRDLECLRSTWTELKDDITTVGVETFMGLFNTHPDAIDSFLVFKDYHINDIEKSAILRAHSLRVMQTVDKCVTRLDEPDKMVDVLTSLGRRHFGYHADNSLGQIMGRQFIAAIEPKLGAHWSDDVRLAWQRLFDVINFHMEQGMRQQEKDSQIGHAQ